MWELIYEDTFGFGEDRDPLRVESSGDSDAEGFCVLWDSVLKESITGTVEKPVEGFARFTLRIKSADGAAQYISIDTGKYTDQLFHLKMNPGKIKEIADRHYKSFLEGSAESFQYSLFGGEK